MPPSYCRLSTLVLKVARVGVGIFRFAPRCATLAIFGGGMRGVGCRGFCTVFGELVYHLVLIAKTGDELFFI